MSLILSKITVIPCNQRTTGDDCGSGCFEGGENSRHNSDTLTAALRTVLFPNPIQYRHIAIVSVSRPKLLLRHRGVHAINRYPHLVGRRHGS
jgi:hypothetical protein